MAMFLLGFATCFVIMVIFLFWALKKALLTMFG